MPDLKMIPRDSSALVGTQDLALQFTRAKFGKACGPFAIPPELLAIAPKELADIFRTAGDRSNP